MKQVLIYSLKVWLTSVVFSPVLFFICDSMLHSNDLGNLSGALGFIGYSITYGLVISIPSWLILFLFSGSLVNRQLKLHYKRILITAVSIVLSILPFYLLFRGDDNGFDLYTKLWSFSYCSIIVAGVWYYRLEPKTDPIQARE